MDNLQLHLESVARAKRPIIWRKLRDGIELAVSNQNISATSDKAGLTALKLNLTIEPNGDALHISKPNSPVAQVDVQWVEERLVTINYRYQRSDLAHVHTWEDYLEFRVDRYDNVQLLHKGEPILLHQAALLIMSPLNGQSFNPPEDAKRT